MWLLYMHVHLMSSSELQLHYESKVSLDDGDNKWQKRCKTKQQQQICTCAPDLF